MLRIPKEHDWIRVDSAFGGAGIYKSEIFTKFDYSTLDESSSACEHKDLNYKIARSGGALYINPAFINRHVNAYNLNKIRIVRFLRKIKNL
jgi:hypothetical protein